MLVGIMIVYRKVFAMKQWESVKCVQFYCDRLDFRNVMYKMQLKFFLEMHVRVIVLLSLGVLSLLLETVFSLIRVIMLNFVLGFSNINKSVTYMNHSVQTV